MSRVTLIECQPRRPDGTVETLRLVDRSPRAAAYLDEQWLPLVTELPAFEMAIGFDGQRFGAAPTPQIGALAFALAPEIRAAAGWVWRDAPVTIRQADWPVDGSNPPDGAFTLTSVCNASAFSSGEGVARVELIDKGQLLRVPVAPLRFGSTGIALLDAAAAARDRQAGQVVPIAFGRVLNLPGLLVDRANNIWLFAARPAASVQAFYDGGVPFTLGSARANLAALQGTAPAAGTVDWCLNAGGLLLARPADRPVYPFTCDATFGSAALGDIATAIVGGRLAFRAGVIAALNGLGLGDCGLYIDDETTVAEALDRLLAGLGRAWMVRTDGTVDVVTVQWDSPAASFAAHQRHAPRRLQTILPTGRRQLGYARNNRVHGESEIARILLATDLTYADGTPIEALKPAQAGANLTAPNAANRWRQSRMEGNRDYGVIFNPFFLAIPFADYGEFQGMRFFKAEATATAAGQEISIGTIPSSAPWFRLTPGERVLFQARVEVAGAAADSWSLELWGFQADNVTQAPIGSLTGSARFIGSGMVGFEVDVPSWCVAGRGELRAYSDSAGPLQVALSEPMISSVVPGQTLRPPFTPGPNASNGADVTGQNTALDTANVGGVPAGNVITDIGTAQATANSKARTFSGSATPVGANPGDYWAIPGEQRLRRLSDAYVWEVQLEFIANARTSFTPSMPGSSTFTSLGTATLGVGPNGTVQVSASISYQPTPGLGAVSGALELAIYWRPVPGSGGWTQIGATAVGSIASRGPDIAPGEPGESTPGSVTIVRNPPAPASVSNQEFMIMGRRTGTAMGAIDTPSAIISWVP